MNLVASNGDGGLGGLLGSLRADMRSPPPGSGRRRQAAGWRGLSVDLITNPEMMQHCGGKEDGVDGLNGGVEKMKEVGKVVDKVKDQGKGEIVGPEERLDGRVVKRIWRTSKLGDAKLKEIWWVSFIFASLLYSSSFSSCLTINRTECDPSGTGSIDRNTFVKAMWKIDEELRRAQLHRNTPPTFSDLQKRRSTRMVQ